MRPAVRAALVALSRTPLADATAQALPADVNRDCREALLEIITITSAGPLKSGRIHRQGRRARRGQADDQDDTRPPVLGIRHVALYVADLAAAERFWVDVMGYAVEWRPDPDNVYLRGGADNLALHRAQPSGAPADGGRLDHIGIAVAAAARRRRLGSVTSRRQGVVAQGAAQDAPRRLAVALFPRSRGAAGPDHPPLADGRVID